MLRNYFLTAWRNLKKNKLTAGINVLGLTVAFTCCIVLFLMVQRQFSYDRFHKNVNRIFKVYSVSHAREGDKLSASMAYPAAPAFKAEVPGVEKSTPYMWAGQGIRYGDKELAKSIQLVSADFFSMFSFPVKAGNRANPLASESDIALNETTAKALFGDSDAIGKSVEVKLGSHWKTLTVSAVLEDAPDNSTLQFQTLARIEINNDYPELKNNWNFQHHNVYVQLKPNITQATAEKELREVVKHYRLANEEEMNTRGFRKDAAGDYYAFKLASLNSLRFNEELGGRNAVSKLYLYTLLLIAVVVMFIACFNFVNLNVARSLTRAREVGVRKTIGAGKKQIFTQLWSESFLLCLMALLPAILLVILCIRTFGEKVSPAILLQPLVVLSILGGMLFVSFLAGGYPAWLVSRFNTVEVLKGKLKVSRSSGVRNGLILFQFVMASLLICSTIVIFSQFQHLRNAPLGYEQESLISIPIKNTDNSQHYLRAFRQQMAAHPEVVQISASDINLGIGKDGSQASMANGFSYKDKIVNTGLLNVDYDYLKTIGIPLLAGREFSAAFPSDTAQDQDNIVITESMAKQLDEKQVIGLSFYTDSAKPKWTVIGVIPDFHLYSMHEKVEPLTLHMGRGGYGYILVKVNTGNPRHTLTMIQDAYRRIEPANKIEASYITENTLRWYEKEQRLSTLFGTAASIAILLSCLGLFAIVQLVMEQRRKEIGVRKVLGASVQGITRLLCKDFLRLVLVAFLIAVPVAWYFLNQWLQNFQYHISIYWWIFPFAGLVMLLIALGTIGFQTLKAALANPVQSLRSE
ncbi:ABC-type antimicrobial peptide transport system permease subunit [Filimonas zeae]|uniref:ABC transporter permease n=1 Tax=Filimonas zeae TaxID=1737353 RepID=A0A917J437_9BACT|nr:ABC transporter permease [Filimonas zeae]MDR6342188.1 ABC-type antimicrobial peptide transport system permease subunit [Filimonas zeae]GGH78764.1 ABC transporter permease [Filimonas zeae]